MGNVVSCLHYRCVGGRSLFVVCGVVLALDVCGGGAVAAVCGLWGGTRCGGMVVVCGMVLLLGV